MSRLLRAWREPPLKAITLTQPWASLVAKGAKRIETRSWRTRYRGPLAIHAAKALPRPVRDLCEGEPLRSALASAGMTDVELLPRGAVIALCRVTHCRRTEECAPPEPESLFGNYSPGRFAWLLAGVRPLDQPIPARGQLGLWNTGPAVEQAILAQIGGGVEP